MKFKGDLKELSLLAIASIFFVLIANAATSTPVEDDYACYEDLSGISAETCP